MNHFYLVLEIKRMKCSLARLNTKPSVEPIDLVPINTVTANAGNTDSLQHTFETLLQNDSN